MIEIERKVVTANGIKIHYRECGNGPPMVRISARMVRYQRHVFENWLHARTVNSTSEKIEAA